MYQGHVYLVVIVIPHLLAYKIHVVVCASEKRQFRDWSYIKGGLIA
jgi:hypothetical protein